jgi:hypothetical protein
MSVLGRKPFVDYIIDACDKDRLIVLDGLLNNLGTPVAHISFGDVNDDFLGVNYVVFNLNELQNQNTSGILIYIDNDHCGFFSCGTNSSIMSAYKLNLVKHTFDQIYENLTVEEFRQVANDRKETIDCSPENIRSSQTTTAVIRTFVYNINSYKFRPGYSTKVMVGGYFDGNLMYPYISLADNTGNEDIPFTKEMASEWMKFMTGSEYVPEYNGTLPQNTFIILGKRYEGDLYSEDTGELIEGATKEYAMAELVYKGSLWKPEWKDGTFRLYFVSNPYKGIVQNNVTVENWVADSTYSDYGYKAVIGVGNIHSSSVVEVIFGVNEAVSGNYAPICETGEATVTIYSKVNNPIVIPTIKEIV